MQSSLHYQGVNSSPTSDTFGPEVVTHSNFSGMHYEFRPHSEHARLWMF